MPSEQDKEMRRERLAKKAIAPADREYCAGYSAGEMDGFLLNDVEAASLEKKSEIWLLGYADGTRDGSTARLKDIK